jgi:hypothetical protein
MQLTAMQERNFLLKFKAASNDCWEWAGSLNKDGYGHFMVNTRPFLAHRISYEYFNEPIPENLVIDHLCRNHSCVNPAHLEAVTTKENLARGEKPGMQAKETTKCLYGHFLTKENTYQGYTKQGRSTRLCKTCRNESILKFKQKAS